MHCYLKVENELDFYLLQILLLFISNLFTVEAVTSLPLDYTVKCVWPGLVTILQTAHDKRHSVSAFIMYWHTLSIIFAKLYFGMISLLFLAIAVAVKLRLIKCRDFYFFHQSQ